MAKARYTPINASASGSNAVIPAIPNGSIVVVKIFVQNLSANDTVAKVMDGATAINGAGTLLGTKDTFVFESALSDGSDLLTLGKGNALTLNLDAANQHGGFVLWYPG